LLLSEKGIRGWEIALLWHYKEPILQTVGTNIALVSVRWRRGVGLLRLLLKFDDEVDMFPAPS
jgi:hypothetical protein